MQHQLGARRLLFRNPTSLEFGCPSRGVLRNYSILTIRQNYETEDPPPNHIRPFIYQYLYQPLPRFNRYTPVNNTNMPTSLTSKVLQGIAVSTVSSIGAFFVWTKHCKIEQLQPNSDPLFANQWYKKLNANANPTLHDECVRRLPLFKLRPELVEDASKGGSKLVEGLSQGVWGGHGTSSRTFSFYSAMLVS